MEDDTSNTSSDLERRELWKVHSSVIPPDKPSAVSDRLLNLFLHLYSSVEKCALTPLHLCQTAFLRLTTLFSKHRWSNTQMTV